MIRGWFWCSALLLSALVASRSMARGSVEEDHAADEHGHEDETVNSCPGQESLVNQFNLLAEEYGILSPGGDGSLCQIASLPEIHETNISTVRVGAEDVLTCQSMYGICQQLILQVNLTTEECLEGDRDNDTDSDGVSSAQAYGYGFLMVAFISLGSLCGVVIVPLVSTDSKLARVVYEYAYAFMIAVGASALLSDAILHLIPHAFDLHGHEEEEEEESGKDFIWKGCLVLGGIYLFFLLEIALHGLGRFIKKKAHNHGKEEEATVHHHCHSDNVHYSPEININSPKTVASVNDEVSPGDTKAAENGTVEQGRSEEEEDEAKIMQPKICDLSCRRIKPVAWLVLLGDTLHNFADGLALGAAVAQSIPLGLSTMIALIFHELPHELGDYAILLKSGIHWCTALLLNFASSLSSFVGFFIGVAISTHSDEANGWILSIAAGLFIYIALVDLLPEIVHGDEHSHGDDDEHDHKKKESLTSKGHRWWIRFGLVNLGFFASFIFLLIIAIYEEDLEQII